MRLRAEVNILKVLLHQENPESPLASQIEVKARLRQNREIKVLTQRVLRGRPSQQHPRCLETAWAALLDQKRLRVGSAGCSLTSTPR